jgi:hypothetical protein
MILLEEIAEAQGRFAQQRIKPFQLNADFIFVERDGANYLFLEDTSAAVRSQRVSATIST